MGRADDLVRLQQALREHQLVTVAGPGGVGKTSLAMAAVHQAEFERCRLVLVELAELDGEEAVRFAVAAKLQVCPHSGEPLGAALSPTPDDDDPLLVLIDNCEHLVSAVAEVVEGLLTAGPHVRVLTTSREPLHLPGECVLVLEPLALPVSPDDVDAPHAPAVVLFARRAGQADASFRIDERTLPHVVRICRALDGMPLALEIAAARVRVLSVRDIADELAAPLRLLRHARRRRMTERHRSVRAVVDWSYELLDPSERTLLSTMAVYPGGFDLDAATAAAGASGIDRTEIVDLLDGLIAKSLLTVSSADGRTRYRMLEAVRAYGIERLEESGRLDRARDHHADHYAEVSRGPWNMGLSAWTTQLSTLAQDFDNVRAAVAWTTHRDSSPGRAFDLVTSMCYMGMLRSAEEIAVLIETVLERWPDPRLPRWSEVAATSAGALVSVEKFARARARAQAAVAASDSTVGAALAWCALAVISQHCEHDTAAALAHLDRADAAAEASGFEPYRGELLCIRAEILSADGAREQSVAAAERALAIATEQGNLYTRGWALQLMGMLSVKARPAAAHRWLEAALTTARSQGYPYGITASLRGLAILAAEEGDLGSSATLFTEALTTIEQSGFLAERWDTLAAMAPLLVRVGRRQSAAVLLVAVESADAAVSPLQVPTLDDTRAELAVELALDAVTARGRALRVEQLLSFVHQELQAVREERALATSDPAEAGPFPAGPSAVPPNATQAELARVGNLWRVTYAGTSVHLPSSKGMSDLAALLAQPGRDLAALDLAAGTQPGARQPTIASAAASANLGRPGDLGPTLDAQARAAYTARIRELQSDLDEADAAGDVSRGTRAQDELDVLTRELSTAYGLRGPRRVGDPAEKARSAVTMRLRATLAKVGSAHPELGAHLRRSISTGRFCRYDPEEPVRWQVSR